MPTEAGQHFYEHAKLSIEEADQADLAARGAGNGLSGRLRICGPVTFARLHVIPHLPNFLAEHPALEGDITLEDRRIDLIESGCDVALRMGDLADSALTVRKIAQARRLVIGTRSYFEAAGEPRTPTDLVGHRAVIHNYCGEGTLWTFRQGTIGTSVTLNGKVRISAAEGVREAGTVGRRVRHRLGMDVRAGAGGRNRPLRAAGLGAAAGRPLAVFPTGRRASAKARAFASFIEAQLKWDPELLIPFHDKRYSREPSG